MRTHFRCLLPVGIVWCALVSPLPAQVPQLINYQGRVVVGTTNFNGTGKFKFALVITTGLVTQWSNDGTSSSGSEPTTAVSIPVVNGLYSVLLGDTSIANMTQAIPTGAFTFSSDIRLRIWFDDGVRGFQLLTPDQRISASPWAIVARTVIANAITSSELANGAVSIGKIANGVITSTQISSAAGITGSQLAANTIGAAQIAPNSITAAELASNAVSASELQNGAVTSLKILDGTITSPDLASTITLGDPTVSGDLSFGAQTRQMINLYNSTYGIGIQASTLYERSSGGNFAWFKGGVHSDAAFDPGGGALTMRLDPNGELHVAGPVAGLSIQNRQSTSYVTTPAAGERWDAFVTGGVYHLWSGADKLTVDLNGKLTAASALFSVNGTAVTATGAGRGVEASATGTGIAVRAIDGAGGGSISSTGVYGESTQSNGNGVVGVANTGTDAFAIWGKSTNGYAGVFDGKVQINGTATVNVLTIVGGADLAEPFLLSKKDLPKGSVVVIDEENPGHLKESAAPYDTRVAGVISGANGVRPGIRLQQNGVLEGDENVALSGRVYVRAESWSGEIKPGDLLTTSEHPGCAMRVNDHARAQGAILGKAMSGLKEREGYVLVLVTLQ